MTVAPISFAANVGVAQDGGGFYNAFPVGAGVVPLSTTLIADEATVAADVATLVADGASPTQGHVNTLNTDWTAFKAVLDSYRTAADASTTANVSITFDKTAITNMNQLKSALKNILNQIAGSGILTP